MKASTINPAVFVSLIHALKGRDHRAFQDLKGNAPKESLIQTLVNGLDSWINTGLAQMPPLDLGGDFFEAEFTHPTLGAFRWAFMYWGSEKVLHLWIDEKPILSYYLKKLRFPKDGMEEALFYTPLAGKNADAYEQAGWEDVNLSPEHDVVEVALLRTSDT